MIEIPEYDDGLIKTRQIVVTPDTKLPFSATVTIRYIVREPEIEEALSSPEKLAEYKESHEYLDDLTLAEKDGSEVYSRFGYSAIWQVIAAADKEGSGLTLYYDVPESTWIYFGSAEDKEPVLSDSLSSYRHEILPTETDLAQYLMTK